MNTSISKKRFTKSTMFLSLFVTLSLLLVGCNDSEKEVKDAPKEINQVDDVENPKIINLTKLSDEEINKRNKESEKHAIEVGTYEIGKDKDLPAGEYMVVADTFGLVEVSKPSEKASDDNWKIIYNATLTEKGNLYVSVKDGERLEVIGGKFYPSDKAPVIIPSDKSTYKNGMYKVGQDITEGSYTVSPIKPTTDTTDKKEEVAPVSYMEVYNTARFSASKDYKSILLNEPTPITLSKGDFIFLQNAVINVSDTATTEQ